MIQFAHPSLCNSFDDKDVEGKVQLSSYESNGSGARSVGVHSFYNLALGLHNLRAPVAFHRISQVSTEFGQVYRFYLVTFYFSNQPISQQKSLTRDLRNEANDELEPFLLFLFKWS